MNIEELKPNKVLRGPLFPEPVQVIVTVPMNGAVKLVGRGLQSGKVVDAVVGYNPTSVARFKARYGDRAKYDADGYPRNHDPLWCQWRRDQVTQFVRRLYLEATASKPSIVVSAALVAWALVLGIAWLLLR